MQTVSLLRPFGLVVACASALLLGAPAVAGAARIGVDLRVVGPSGQTLAEQHQVTGAVSLKAGRGADCFGPGTGGSGDRVQIRRATALGAVRDALDAERKLRPLLVTDAFAFGLGVCGIGGFEARGSASWYLKHDHAGAQVGGDQLRVRRGDDVLWHLAPGFPYPVELALETPARAKPGEAFDVRVFAYADDGTRAPAEGATVGGGDLPAVTDAQGRAAVTAVSPGAVTLQATRGEDIPSNGARVCLSDRPGDCPAAQGRVIVGTVKRDTIKGTKGPDSIKARGGNDVVRARGGGADRINCGPGKRDIAYVDREDTVRRCARVRRK